VQGIGNFASFLPLNGLPWQRPLTCQKKKDVLIICHSMPTIWCEDCENRFSGYWDTSARSEEVRYDTKLVAMATFLEKSENLTWSRKFTQIPSIWWKDRENRSVDTEIALLIVKKNKKEEINASKIYSPSGKFAKRAKWTLANCFLAHQQTCWKGYIFCGCFFSYFFYIF